MSEFVAGPAEFENQQRQQPSIFAIAERAPAAPKVAATPEMVCYCYDLIVCHFQNAECPNPRWPRGEFPLFVTWEKQSPEGLVLRGCIGTLSPCPLDVLKTYTFNSALHDDRFTPIVEQELPQLQCSVSLLVNYESCRDVNDWLVGQHGLVLDFTDSEGEKYSATYLPEIAVQQGWNQQETIESLIQKSGYTGRITPQLLASVSMTRYQSSRCTLSYFEYLDLKKTNTRRY